MSIYWEFRCDTCKIRVSLFNSGMSTAAEWIEWAERPSTRPDARLDSAKRIILEHEDHAIDVWAPEFCDEDLKRPGVFLHDDWWRMRNPDDSPVMFDFSDYTEVALDDHT